MITNIYSHRIPNNYQLKSHYPKVKQTDSVNFTGLTAKLSNNLYENPSEVKELIDKYPNSKGIVGNLPPNWIDKTKTAYPEKESRKEVIKNIYSAFSEAASILRDQKTAGITNASEKLRDALKKAKVEENFENLEYKGAGVFGSGYKFTVDGKNYILKVHHKTGDYSSLDSFHKIPIEANRGAFWKKNAPKDERHAKFYFAGINEGYGIVEFIDKDTPLPKKIVDNRMMNLVDTDLVDDDNMPINQIRGRIIEYGGQDIISPIAAKNKNLRFVFKSFLKLPVNKRIEFLEKGSYYKDFKNIKDVNLKNNFETVLLDNFDSFGKDEKATYFKLLAQKGNKDIKPVLPSKLKDILDSDKVECFRTLIQNCDDNDKSNEKLQKALLDIFLYLPTKETKLDCYKVVNQSNNESLKNTLQSYLRYITSEDKAYILANSDHNKDV